MLLLPACSPFRPTRARATPPSFESPIAGGLLKSEGNLGCCGGSHTWPCLETLSVVTLGGGGVLLASIQCVEARMLLTSHCTDRPQSMELSRPQRRWCRASETPMQTSSRNMAAGQHCVIVTISRPSATCFSACGIQNLDFVNSLR